MPKTYLFSHCDLAYAVTAHVAEGQTVDTAHTLVDGLGDRQGQYVSLSRGRDGNYVYAVTAYPHAADVREGSRPAPELDRVHRLMRERAGLPPQAPATDDTQHRDPVSVVAEVMARDGAQLSATETLRRELSNADHLGVLGSIWYDLARRAQLTRFETMLRDNLLPADAEQALRDAACTWLWRSLREAETAGLDAAEVLQQAVASRPLEGTRDVARVLDFRVRGLIEHTVPQIRESWAERVPEMGDPEMDRFMTDLATVMDGRVRRIGEHIAQTQPLWATQALGPVPDDLVAREQWQTRAAKLGEYRELYGYEAPGDAIGPEPGKTSPEARRDWHAAFAMLAQSDGIDVRSLSEGQLRLRRGMYQQETAWAPPHVGEELRLARLQARTAWENTIRAEHDARAATAEAAERHERLASLWRAMHDKATHVAGKLAAAQETRRQWDVFTERTRRTAIAADHELRRRHPGIDLEPLRSAEPAGILDSPPPSPQREEVWIQPPLDGFEHLAVAEPGTAEPLDGNEQLTSAQREAYGQQALGLTPGTGHEEIPGQVQRVCDNVRKAQDIIDRHRGTPEYTEHDTSEYLGPAWGDLARRERDAILQPPKPDITPASELAHRAQERQAIHSSAEHE